MGLSSSKNNAPGQSSSSSSAEVVSRNRSTRSRVLKSSCLRSHCAENSEIHVSNCPSEKNGNTMFGQSENTSGSCQVSPECYESSDVNCIRSGIPWGESSFTNTMSREANTSRSLNPPNRLLSRFSVNPRNLSFRLKRDNSVTSTGSYPTPSMGFTISNAEECVVPSTSTVDRNYRPQGCEFFPACFTSRSPEIHSRNYASNSSPDFSGDIQDNRRSNNTRVDSSPNTYSHLYHSNTDDAGMRQNARRLAAREPVERNVRFSRTLSVGRLRDRVLRRSPASDLELYHFQQDREARQNSEGQISEHAEVEATSDDNTSSEPGSSDNVPSRFPNPFYSSQSNFHGTPRNREIRYRDLLEHRSNFIERRRRIRSQVRALQRLGSRFENLSVHERSCILSGQHQGGHCTCHTSAREANSNDDANARASISRIVMLAEALFEVLDEIHQQSVALSSRPSVSSIGSVPAPIDAVNSLPLKMFNKLKRKPCEDDAQCYICLVEYDDGDSMRILPCHHEFHRACIDKWLKEIHRVCPLCRRDICRPGSTTSLQGSSRGS